jgi:Phage conserved hypothetical protein BR0599/Uncharacterized conserved protein (DUF2163)
MRSVSAKTTSLLSGRQYLVADLFDITLQTGQEYHFTSFDVPLNGVSIFSPAAGPFNYSTGLSIKRGEMKRAAGTDGGQLKITLSPRFDSPAAPVLINGYPLLQASRLHFFDGATLQLSRLFMPGPGYVFSGTDVVPGNWVLDVSAQGNGDFLGSIQDVQVSRFKIDITVDNYLALLGNQQMPRQITATGCWHQVYDKGCGLLKSAFTSNSHVTAVTDSAHFSTALTKATGFFNLGAITFTSGINSGLSQNITSYANPGGVFAVRYPFPAPPAVGDTFSVYPGCDLQQSTCTTQFNNLPHFGGDPYTPVPETIIDGGTNAGQAQAAGSQAGTIIGSMPSGQSTYGKFTT